MSKLIISFPTLDSVVFRNTSRTSMFHSMFLILMRQQLVPTLFLFAFACTLLQGISSTYTHVEYVRRTIILLGSKYVLFSLFMSSGEGGIAVSYPELQTSFSLRYSYTSTSVLSLAKRASQGKNTLGLQIPIYFPNFRMQLTPIFICK